MKSCDITAPDQVAIVGAGFIGRSWATIFARAGHAVVLHDADQGVLDQSRAWIEEAGGMLDAAGLGDERSAGFADRIRTTTSLEEAVSAATYVQENAPERLDVKQALFARMDRCAGPETILATSSSAITCSAISADLPGRHRCIVAHPANPPHLLKAVEVVPAPFTDQSTIDRTMRLMTGIGQVPVRVAEVDGFVMNRLQAALTQEALALVDAGIADAAAIDAIIRHSLGLRWSFMGPFETMDLNAPGGFDDYARRYGPSFSAMLGGPGWSASSVEKASASRRATLPEEQMPARRAWRDRQLTALVAHFARMAAGSDRA